MALSDIFGYILNFIYKFVNNYGVSIIIFSVLLKILLLPLSIKQQKTMKKTEKLQKEMKFIQDKYKNNPEQMNKEIMDLYKRENLNPLGGCFTSIIQIIIIFAMFSLVKSPLTHMKKINSNTISDYKKVMQIEGKEINSAYPEISIIKYANKIKNGEEIEEKKEEKLESINVNFEDAYINMNFLGLDLSNIPQKNYKDVKVFIIPVLYVISSFISIKLSTKKHTEKIESEENDDKKEQTSEEVATQMTKSMTWMMPFMAVSISIIAPLGLALYWLINNILMIIEKLLIEQFVLKEEEK